MHLGALAAVEFDRIVEALGSFALTPLGATRLAALRPQTDPRRVAALQAGTTETVRYQDEGGEFPLHAPADLEPLLSALAIEGRALEPLRLLGLADFMTSVEVVQAAVRRVGASFPVLKAVTEPAASFQREASEVREKIGAAGDVLDHASGELRSLRDRLRKQRSRLRGTLESYLRGKETARYLQDQIVTDRNGRYVLVVRAEHRASIPGIIHGSSASGASLYLEPLSTVELNNEIVALEEQEAEEVQRILLALTDAFRSRPLDIKRTIEVATEVDVLQAKARFARLVDGVEPLLSADGSLDLRAARHPLLMSAVTARLARRGDAWADPGDGAAENGERQAAAHEARPAAIEPVPVDLSILPPSSVLVITGPNTGGKTVALKTIGLIALMAQAGLHVPAAAGARLPVFRSVFADIGDEQSIAASLSTFSWHITNIAAMDRALSLPALVLLDEIGVGTDPVEGGALGMAIIEHFRQRGALVVATTHYEALKSYASTTEGVVAAGFGFEPDTYAPTYRLTYGSPGRSLAIEIAGRLGLSDAILGAARSYVDAREAQIAEHLAKIEENLRLLDHERRLVSHERDGLRDSESRLHAREELLRQREETARQREETTRRKADDLVDSRLREARQEIDRVVADLKRRTVELAAEAADRLKRQEPTLSTGDTGSVRSEAIAALEQATARFHAAAPAPMPNPPCEPGQRPVVGDRVVVAGLGLEGLLALIHDGDAEVDVQGKRVRVRSRDLQLVARAGSGHQVARVSVSVNMQPRDHVLADLNIIGCTVDEALTRAERFLDETLLTEQRTVRVIHGHGTGQLRRAIAQFLHDHPLVARFESAPPEQGGSGVTVVELKD